MATYRAKIEVNANRLISSSRWWISILTTKLTHMIVAQIPSSPSFNNTDGWSSTAEDGSLENYYTERYQGFKSSTIRFIKSIWWVYRAKAQNHAPHCVGDKGDQPR